MPPLLKTNNICKPLVFFIIEILTKVKLVSRNFYSTHNMQCLLVNNWFIGICVQRVGSRALSRLFNNRKSVKNCNVEILQRTKDLGLDYSPIDSANLNLSTEVTLSFCQSLISSSAQSFRKCFVICYLLTYLQMQLKVMEALALFAAQWE